MIRLDATTRKLQAVLGGAITTNQLPITVCYSDKTSTAYTGGTTVINTNNTTAVDICAAPAASTVRDVDTINVNNADTVAATITIRYNDNGTTYTLFKATLATGDQLTYVHGVGWNVIDSTGKTKVGAGVNGPSSSTDNALVRWDGTAGTAVQNSGWTLSDTDALNGVSGSVGAPSLTLNGETTSGLYRIGANNHGYAISGAKVLDISSTGLAVTGVGSYTDMLTISRTAAGSALTLNGGGTGNRRLDISNGTGALNFGVESSTGGAIITGSTAYASVVNTGGSAQPFQIGVNSVLIGSFSSTGLAVTGTLSATGAGEVASPLVVTGTNLGAAGSVWFGSDANGGGAINVPTGEVFLGLVNQAEVIRYSSTGLAVTGTGAFTGNLTSTGATSAFGAIGVVANVRLNSSSADNTSGTYSLIAYDSSGNPGLQVKGNRDVVLGASIATVSTTGLAVTGTLSSTGSASLGDNAADTHTILGAVTATNANNANSLNLTTTAQSSGIHLWQTNAVDAGTRNWGIFTNYAAYGDLVFRISTARYGDPDAAGSTIAAISSTGLAVTGTLSATGDVTASGGNILSTSGGAIPIRVSGATTGYSVLRIANTGGEAFFGQENSTGNNLIVGDSAYDTVIRGPSGLAFSGNAGAAMQMRLSSSGLAVSTSVAITQSGQAQLINGATGTYSTWQYNGTSVGDIGTADEAVGGSTADFGITSRAGSLVLGTSSTSRLTINSSGSVAISGTGPHAIGGATDSQYQLRLTGSFTGSATAYGLVMDNTLTPTANQQAWGMALVPTLVEASSGTHADFGTLRLDAPAITGGAATLTNASTLKITGAPTGATNNYALWSSGNTRWDSGYLLVSSNTTHPGAGDTFHDFYRHTDTANPTIQVTSACATATNQYGIAITLSGDPNDATRYFLRGVGNVTERFTLRSNGGLANYSANDVNLSDATVKRDKGATADHTNFVKALSYRKFSYLDDQTESDIDGLMAQDVQALDPSLVTEFSAGKLGIYTHRLQEKINSVIPKLIQRIEALESQLQ